MGSFGYDLALESFVITLSAGPLALAMLLGAPGALAQPQAEAPMDRSIPAYVYLMDDHDDKVLVSTQFWRNDPKYDDRAFHRFLDVLAAL